MAARIRKGDTVVVITGTNKGIRGEVLRVFPGADRALVQGVNMVTRHKKAAKMGDQSGRIEQEASRSRPRSGSAFSMTKARCALPRRRAR
jgi:large subunit ribosomal protein L24